MKTINLKCTNCTKYFKKSIYEHRRITKLGRRYFFCGTSCSAIYGNNKRPKSEKPKYKLSWEERIEKYGPKIRTASVISRIKQRAKKKGVPCEITNTLFWEMMEKQDGQCFYSGEQMIIEGKFVPNQATVDRIIPKLGYIKDNMVICCRWANMAKGKGTLKDLVDRANKLVKYQGYHETTK